MLYTDIAHFNAVWRIGYKTLSAKLYAKFMVNWTKVQSKVDLYFIIYEFTQYNPEF